MNKRFYKLLIDHLEKGFFELAKTKNPSKYTNDQYWKLLQPTHKWYYFNQRIGIQRPGFSNIENKYVEYKV